MIVTNLRTCLIRAASINFTPGKNVVPDSLAEIVKSNRGFQSLVAAGTLGVDREKGEPGVDGNLSAAEMCAVVRGINSVEDLTKLKREEKRRKVVKAIDDRIAELARRTAKDGADS